MQPACARGATPGYVHCSRTQADSAIPLYCRWVSRPSDYMLAHFALFAQVSGSAVAQWQACSALQETAWGRQVAQAACSTMSAADGSTGCASTAVDARGQPLIWGRAPLQRVDLWQEVSPVLRTVSQARACLTVSLSSARLLDAAMQPTLWTHFGCGSLTPLACYRAMPFVWNDMEAFHNSLPMPTPRNHHRCAVAGGC